MAAESFAEIVNALTPEQQSAMREFVDFLRAKNADRKSPFQAAVGEFIEQLRTCYSASRSDLPIARLLPSING